MKLKNAGRPAADAERVLVVVDESNLSSSVRNAGRGLDWLKLRDFLAGPTTGRQLIEMVVYVGLPPATVSLAEERERKSKFVHWLRSHGFMVVTKDGAPTEEGRYKANVDIMMAIDVIDLSDEMQPDVVILVTGDADFAHLVTKLRRRGIRVEVASVAQHLGQMLKSAASHVIELEPLFHTFEVMAAPEVNRSRPAHAAAPRPQRAQQRQPQVTSVSGKQERRKSGEPGNHPPAHFAPESHRRPQPSAGPARQAQIQTSAGAQRQRSSHRHRA